MFSAHIVAVFLCANLKLDPFVYDIIAFEEVNYI